MLFRPLVIVLLISPWAAAETPISFNRDVRPIMAENCFHCHGADAAQRQAELRLDDRTSAIEMGAIAPGKPDDSTLVERIKTDDADLRMPPPDSHRRLTRDQIELLTRWVAQGALYEAHWAFEPVRKPKLPQVREDAWPRNAVDHFVLARLEKQELSPSPRAPLPMLLRRISFDVTGLPATSEQLAKWNASAEPIGAALDELLASPHYGERMAVDWLDVARYADTHGFNNDSLRIMWRWRDWVVDAFNENMPYDQFIIKQLAGDLLPEASLEDRLATGFNRNHVINSEGGIIDEEYRVEYVADRVRTMSLAWLGLTLECARCHDHKFDPISQRDYYQMFAFFNNVDEFGEDGRVGNAAPLMRAPTKEQQHEYAELLKREERLEAELRDLINDAQRIISPASRGPEGQTSDAVPGNPALKAAENPTAFPPENLMNVKASGFDLNGGWLFATGIRPGVAGAAPLISTMNYSAPPSAQGYGAGMQVGLTSDGAVDVRLAARWPAYSLNVRSAATVPVGEWSHIAVVGQGNSASGIRIFMDGIEVETEIRHDDLTRNISIGDRVNVGHAGEPANNRFTGELHRLLLVPGELDEATLETFLTTEALLHRFTSASDSHAGHRQLLATVNRSDDDKLKAQFADWKQARQERLAFLRSFPTVMIVRELPRPREAFVLERGLYDKLGERVSPDVPDVLGLPLPAGPRDRRALARWFTDPRHPLTARVVVNRFWQGFFGVGLVKSVEDFGVQGEWPSHPELLDWLAADFIESGWDVKRLLRMIVESAAYQQDSTASAEHWANDPENRLIARGPRQRLAAEMIRDQALAVSGLLAPKLGGPPVFPYQPADLYKGIVVQAGYPGTTYTQSTGEDLYRRSLYTFWKRTVPHPTLSTFDAPDREFCTARRSVTNTPLQALALMNDPAFLEAARKLGERMLKEGGETDEARMAWAFELLTARSPEENEVRLLVELLKTQRGEFSSKESIPKGLLEAGESKPGESHTAAELAAYANVASLLLNLDEVITRN